MLPLGILFDIDDLGGGFYGYAAYKILFSSIERSRLRGCTILDGDTTATLNGNARIYCIAIHFPDPAQLAAVKTMLSRSGVRGLVPLSSRFIEGTRVLQEPLVQAGVIDEYLRLTRCETPWIIQAWNETAGSNTAAATNTAPDARQVSHHNSGAGNTRPAAERTQSQPRKLFAQPFSFSGRIRRLEYGLSMIFLLVSAVIVQFLAIYVMEHADAPWAEQNQVGSYFVETDLSPLSKMIFYACFILINWFAIAQGVKRCHDLGWSGWFVLIPLIIFWLLFKDGQPHENNYGTNPKGLSLPGYTANPVLCKVCQVIVPRTPDNVCINCKSNNWGY